jgi:Caspase domain
MTNDETRRPGPLQRLLRLCIGLQFVGLASLYPAPARADDAALLAPATDGSRVALVIGQSDYRGLPLPSATADATVIANNLEAAGFEVEAGSDQPEFGISERISSFIEKINRNGTATTGVVYISGRFAQINGENLLLPVTARIDRASDAALYGYSIQKLLSALAAVPMKACVIMIDASAPPDSIAGDNTFAPGLAIIDPPKGFLLSYSQNPGIKLTDPTSKTGQFAAAFLEALQQPIDSFPDLFKIIRVRVYDETAGGQRPWDADKLTDPSFSFFPSKDGMTPPAPLVNLTNLVPVAALPHDEAYKQVIAIDTIQSYQSFIKAFPNDAAVPSIQYNLAVRREAEVWADTLRLDTADGYWTYIQSYPDGGNVGVARERLARLGQPAVQPANFTAVAFDNIPPPLASGEIIASSASMPVEFMPPPPSMQLPVVPDAVVAAIAVAAAIPVVYGRGPRAVPSVAAASMHPTWAAPVAFNPNRPVAARAVAPAFATSGMPRATPVVARPAGTVQPLSPPAVGAARPGVQPLNQPAAATQPVRNLAAAAAPPMRSAIALPPAAAATAARPASPVAPIAPRPMAAPPANIAAATQAAPVPRHPAAAVAAPAPTPAGLSGARPAAPPTAVATRTQQAAPQQQQRMGAPPAAPQVARAAPPLPAAPAPKRCAANAKTC